MPQRMQMFPAWRAARSLRDRSRSYSFARTGSRRGLPSARSRASRAPAGGVSLRRAGLADRALPVLEVACRSEGIDQPRCVRRCGARTARGRAAFLPKDRDRPSVSSPCRNRDPRGGRPAGAPGLAIGGRLAGRTSSRSAVQPRCLRSQKRPRATAPQAWRPPRAAQARADDDLRAVRAHRLGLRARDHNALRLAPALRVRRPGLDRANVSVDMSPETLDHEAVVAVEAASEIVNQKGRCGIAGHRHRCRHGVASVSPVMMSGGHALPRTSPAAAPLTVELHLLAARGRAGGDGCD